MRLLATAQFAHTLRRHCPKPVYETYALLDTIEQTLEEILAPTPNAKLLLEGDFNNYAQRSGVVHKNWTCWIGAYSHSRCKHPRYAHDLRTRHVFRQSSPPSANRPQGYTSHNYWRH